MQTALWFHVRFYLKSFVLLCTPFVFPISQLLDHAPSKLKKRYREIL